MISVVVEIYAYIYSTHMSAFLCDFRQTENFLATLYACNFCNIEN